MNHNLAQTMFGAIKANQPISSPNRRYPDTDLKSNVRASKRNVLVIPLKIWGRFYILWIIITFLLLSFGNSSLWGQSSGQGQRTRRPMTAERFARLQSNPEILARIKANTPPDMFAKWQAGDFSSQPESSGTPGSDSSANSQEQKKSESGENSGENKDRQNSNGSVNSNSEESPDMTHEEFNKAVLEMMKQGTVPVFENPLEDKKFTMEDENEYYYKAIERQKDSITSNVPLTLRKYSRYLIHKYDTNLDGILQQSEWKPLAGAQNIDLNGDFQLDEDELVYYMAKYAKNRNIFRSALQSVNREPVLPSGSNIKIRPLSAKDRPTSKEQRPQTGESEKNENFSDLLHSDSDEESVDQVERLLDNMSRSPSREFSVPPEQLKGLPRWFILRDSNGDGQLSLREFAPTLNTAAIAFFGRLDLNADGLVTPEEMRQALGGNGGGNRRNNRPPR